ncbi:fatty acid-binding protein, adipocyte [Eurytemora carolleeae]|uniref:fatty acid-binding protein, adipocyte n=1 Tax=Eurytemora carolleeae TaxID=1294199 RepID=UPI000C78BBFD|nr:fatty acid-binding protein, adipocyte [Eurytemora carolleeae]|eukprot:XP_023324660.1 fatty acid-binding protein, adipocyte-like [Eurytemora affinis]
MKSVVLSLALCSCILAIEAQRDPLPGTYRMVSSDRFDDYLQALGVNGLVRSIAAGIVPTNVIEIDSSGRYTVRTLTPLRNSEISFRLQQPFVENTSDGRKVTTVATRSGNVLTLNQRGSGGQKSTTIVREINGDTMINRLIVDNVTSVRVFKRIN